MSADPSLRRQAERRGRRAEWSCLMLLACKGYRPLGRRVRTPFGEIDLIAARGHTLVFVEVKQRASETAALEAVSARGREMASLSVEDNGAMAAVFGPLVDIERIVAETPGYVVVANINSNNQAVVGGSTDAVLRAQAREMLRSRGESLLVVAAGAACIGPVDRYVAMLTDDADERRRRLDAAACLAARTGQQRWVDLVAESVGSGG